MRPEDFRRRTSWLLAALVGLSVLVFLIAGLVLISRQSEATQHLLTTVHHDLDLAEKTRAQAVDEISDLLRLNRLYIKLGNCDQRARCARLKIQAVRLAQTINLRKG